MATKAITTLGGMKSAEVEKVFTMYMPQISRVLPKHLTPERMVQTMVTMVTKNQAIAQCTTESLIGALLQASQLGFEPIDNLQLCHLVPFNNSKTGKKEVQFILGYRGMISLARRSGEVMELYAEVVRKGDKFKWVSGLNRDLIHEKLDFTGDILYAYAVAKYRNGGYDFAVVTRREIDEVKRKSKAGNSGPWVDYFEAMAMKTAIRRLWKFLPFSVEIMKLAEIDNVVISPVSKADVADDDYVSVQYVNDVSNEADMTIDQIKEKLSEAQNG